MRRLLASSLLTLPAPAFVGLATAHATDDIISVNVPANSGAFASGSLDCTQQGDKSHPYLVLDYQNNTSRRTLRSARYNLGTGSLGFEWIVPAEPNDLDDRILPQPNPYNGYYTGAWMWVQVRDSAFIKGHKSLTLYCASTKAAANQRW